MNELTQDAACSKLQCKSIQPAEAGINPINLASAVRLPSYFAHLKLYEKVSITLSERGLIAPQKFTCAIGVLKPVIIHWGRQRCGIRGDVFRGAESGMIEGGSTTER